jgi:hypothetical protein
MRAKFILSPDPLLKIAAKMLFLLPLLVFMFPDEFGGAFSSKIQNTGYCNFCHVLIQNNKRCIKD